MAYDDLNNVQNIATGSVPIAAWFDQTRDNFQYLSGDFPHASIKETTAQSIPDTDWTALTSNEENSDIGGMHTGSNSTLVVPSGGDGLYLVTASVTFAFNATGERFLGFGVNGADPTYSVDMKNAGTTSGTTCSGVTSFVLAAGDTVECMVFHNRGSALNCTMNNFTAIWLART